MKEMDLPSALARYHRLCDPAIVGCECATHNAMGALGLVREALERAPRLQSMLEQMSARRGEVTSAEMAIGQSAWVAASNFRRLEGYGLATKRYVLLWGARRCLWQLSALGQRLMVQEEKR